MKRQLEDFTLDEIVNLSGETFADICKESNLGVLSSTKVVVECKYTEMKKVRDTLIKEADTIQDKDQLSITLNSIVVALQKLEDCATIIQFTIQSLSKPRN